MSWKYSDPALWEAAVNADNFPKGDIAKSYLEWMKHPEYAILKNKEMGIKKVLNESSTI